MPTHKTNNEDKSNRTAIERLQRLQRTKGVDSGVFIELGILKIDVKNQEEKDRSSPPASWPRNTYQKSAQEWHMSLYSTTSTIQNLLKVRDPDNHTADSVTLQPLFSLTFTLV